jgi:hypothetical protein
VGQQGSASGSLLLDLDGLEVVSAELVGGEWQLAVQTTATVVGCGNCGVRATPHGRRLVRVRDLPVGGRPVVLWWRKRLWRCREPACRVRTWTERVTGIAPRAVLTQRARAEACRRVSKDAHAVAAVARDLGVGWATIMRAVADHGTPLVEDPTRLDGVAALGLDETSFLKATRLAPTRWVTGLVDLERGRLPDVVADRTRAAVDGWLGGRPAAWLARIAIVALDPWRGYAGALVAPLGHATVVELADVPEGERAQESPDRAGCHDPMGEHPAVAPQRSTSASSMQPPPASIEWTRVNSLRPGRCAPGRSPRSISASAVCSIPSRSARVATSSRPALATAWVSSKQMSSWSRVWEDPIEKAPS